MKAIDFENLKVGENYSVVFLPGMNSEEFFKVEIKVINDFCAVGKIDRRILLKYGGEIMKGQLVYLHKNKNDFYECN